MTIKDEILAILAELGGEVTDPEGRAVRKIAERVASTGTYTTVSTAMSELDYAGLIVRDQPSLKRTTRVALAGPDVRPGRKAVEVIAEQASRGLAEKLKAELTGVVDAHVAAATDGVQALEEALAETRAALAEANRRLGVACQQRDEARARADVAERAARTAHAAREAAEEQARVTERNAQVWRKQALGRPQVRELLTQVKDELPPGVRRDLERLMTSLPAGRG